MAKALIDGSAHSAVQIHPANRDASQLASLVKAGRPFIVLWRQARSPVAET